MNTTARRLIQVLLWLLVTLMVALAIAITTLRITLPQLNRFQDEIQTWVNKGSTLDFEIDQISGFWRNTHPSISLQNVRANTPESSGIHFSAQTVEVEFDLIQSVIDMRPVIADLSIHNLKLDMSTIEWVQSGEKRRCNRKVIRKAWFSN